MCKIYRQNRNEFSLSIEVIRSLNDIGLFEAKKRPGCRGVRFMAYSNIFVRLQQRPTCFFRRYAIAPTRPTPASIMVHSEGSGTGLT